jgi:hypothetical protein
MVDIFMVIFPLCYLFYAFYKGGKNKCFNFYWIPSISIFYDLPFTRLAIFT